MKTVCTKLTLGLAVAESVSMLVSSKKVSAKKQNCGKIGEFFRFSGAQERSFYKLSSRQASPFITTSYATYLLSIPSSGSRFRCILHQHGYRHGTNSTCKN
jgi:hypothetical protein